MHSKMASLTLIVLFCLCAPAIAQPPGIDGARWDSNSPVALSQTQGFAQGDPMRLTWGFARELTGPTSIPGFGEGATGNSNLIARMDAIYTAGPGGLDLQQRPWFTHYQSMFDRWSSISGLSYQYEANDDGVTYAGSSSSATNGLLGTRADVRIGGRNIDGNNGVLAFNFFPNVGDMVIDTNDSYFLTTTNNSRRLRNMLAHEHGHGIGMSHVEPSNQTKLMEPFISTSYDGPQHHDILVAQRAYGDFQEKSFNGLGNDVVARSTILGNIAVGATVSVGNAARTLAVPANATDFVSIDDNSDTDFWSFTTTQSAVANILLESLGFIYDTKPQGSGNPEAFDTKQRSDLILTLFGTNGTSILATVNATGLGGNEAINGFMLNAAGTYFVRVTGIDNGDAISLDTQFYGLSVGLTAVPEPTAVTLLGLAGIGLVWNRRHRRPA